MAVSDAELFAKGTLSYYAIVDPLIGPILLNEGQAVCIKSLTTSGQLNFQLFGVLTNNTSGAKGYPSRIAGKLLATADGLVDLYKVPSGYSFEGHLSVANPQSASRIYEVYLSLAGV